MFYDFDSARTDDPQNVDFVWSECSITDSVGEPIHNVLFCDEATGLIIRCRLNEQGHAYIVNSGKFKNHGEPSTLDDRLAIVREIRPFTIRFGPPDLEAKRLYEQKQIQMATAAV